MTVKKSLKVLLAASALMVAPLAAVIVAAPASAQTSDLAKLQITTQVIGNLKIVDVMARAGAQTLLADETVKTLTQPEQDRLVSFYTDGLYAQESVLNEKLATSCTEAFTMEELKVLLRLSQINYIQQLVAQGGDPSLTADPATMTAADRTFYDQYADSDIVMRLASKINFDVIKPELEAITLKAFTDFLAWRAHLPA
ncbi:hypothetical protein [Asticcacaulis sp. AC402]|uniref:hypothetical protein n=1 Tax=Asticcacaulis sp. AC402 TaxID=1282361 RepID=UPI0003C3E75E|nr:hypothetical protein [Asticcacaulis sp. AC402]ESQ77154.1 hypothetical protein ABAC402_01780 [Asticcacaulis sp. AC402]